MRTPWPLIGLLVAAGVVAAFHVGKVPPSIPSIREELGASLGQAGWLLSTVNLITALGGMAIALTADRFGHRRLVLLGTGLCAIASLIGAFAGSVDILLVWRVVEGLGFVAVAVAVPSLLLRIADTADQRLTMAVWTTYMPAGAGTTSRVGRSLARDSDCCAASIADAACMCASSSAMVLKLPEPSRARILRVVGCTPSALSWAAISRVLWRVAVVLGMDSCCYVTIVQCTLFLGRADFLAEKRRCSTAAKARN